MLIDITDPEAVQRAIEEFDRIGQASFLQKYGFGPSRDWLLVQGDREYDAKAILGAAHGYQHPKLGALPASDFHGGDPTARRLRALGFTVTQPEHARRNPTWSRDELILALDLYVRHRPKIPGGAHPEVVELSGMLNTIAMMSNISGTETFRNSDGVAMKLQNFRRFDPEQKGKGLSGGGKGEEEVWNIFCNDRDRLTSTAAAIKAVARETPSLAPVESDIEEAEEGSILTRLHRYRERNRGIVEKRKAKELLLRQCLACEACGFDFAEVYGTHGNGFIECHHTKPVSSLEPSAKTRLEDLVLLCANCHRMIHARRPWLNMEELQEIIKHHFSYIKQ